MDNTPIKFDIYEGGVLARTEILAESTIKIGKLSSSNLRLDDESVSRMHALLEVNGPNHVVILDLGSATGTFVNGERTTKQQLRTGDRVAIGTVQLVVSIAGQAAAASSVAAAPAVVGPLFDEEEEDGSGRALEVMTLWGSSVLDVRHFSGAGTYLVGDSPEAMQFIEPALLPSDPFPLAATDGNDMVVNIPDGVTGEVMLDGTVYSLDDLKAAGKLSRGQVPKSHTLRLPTRARCRMRIGGLTVLVNSVSAARPVGHGSVFQMIDGQALRYLLTAGVLHALFFAIVLSIPEDADRLAMDVFNSEDRFVEFLFTPEENKPEDLKDLFKDMKDKGDEAEKAKGDEGKLGKKDSTERDKRFAVKGPVDQKEIMLAKERAKMEAVNTAEAAFNSMEGELSAVWGEGDQAVGSDAVSALGGMFGDKVGEAHGFGGLGVGGVGRGGGGFGGASIGVGRVGTRGRGGGGKGGYGRGVSRVGERKGKAPRVIPGKPIISGALDKETIRRVIRRHRNEYRYCYEKELNRKRDLNGKIVIKFTIAGNGNVIASSIFETTMKNRNVESCLKRKIKRWVFPAPKGGGIVIVKYPFIFKPS